MRSHFITLFVILVVTQFEEHQAAIALTCSKLDDGSLKMELRTNDYAYLRGYNLADPAASTECRSQSETVTGTVYQVFTVITNANRVQTTPANLTTHNCFPTPHTTDPNAVDYKVLALAQAPATNATLITDNYKYLNLSCDPDTTTQTEILSAAAIETKVTVNSEEVVPTNLQMVLSIVDFTTGLPFTAPVQVGTAIKAKIEFTRTLNENAVALGLNGHTMQISGFADFSQVVNFLDANGCPSIQFNEAQKAGIESGFVEDITNTDQTKFIANTGKLFISGFLGAPTPMRYHLRVSYTLCHEVKDQCNNIVAYCAAQAQSQGQSQGRKRRSSGNIPDEGDLTTSVEITYGPGNNGNQGGMDGKDEDEPTCGDIYKFWVVSSVLGALLLLAMLFAIYLYFRLRREQAHVQKMADKFGVSNTAVET